MSTTLRTPGHSGYVLSCAFSKDGRLFVSASADKTLKIWDVQTGQCKCTTLRGHSERVHCCAFSPDGKSLVSGAGKPAWEVPSSSDNTLKIWDAGTGACNYTLSGHSGEVNACCFSPDGASVLSGSRDKTLKIWDAATGARLRSALRLHLIS